MSEEENDHPLWLIISATLIMIYIVYQLYNTAETFNDFFITGYWILCVGPWALLILPAIIKRFSEKLKSLKVENREDLSDGDVGKLIATIRNSKDSIQRAVAIQDLSDIENEKIIDVMISVLLNDEDTLCRAFAASWLAKHKIYRSIPYLLEALRTDYFLEGVGKALAQFHDPTTIIPVLKIMFEVDDYYTNTGGIDAIKQFSNRITQETILEALGQANLQNYFGSSAEVLIEHFGDAALKAFQQYIADGKNKAVVEQLKLRLSLSDV